MSFTLWGDGKPHAGQVPVWRERERIIDGDIHTLFMACGRRWGKDRLSIWICLYVGLMLAARRENTDLIPPVYQWVLSPTNTLSDVLWAEYKAYTKGITRRLVHTHPRRMELYLNPNRKDKPYTIDFRSAERPETLVGVGLDIVHVTEGGQIKDEAWQEYMGPTLASPGRLGFACVNGTPGTHPSRWYRQLWRRASDGDRGISLVNEPSLNNPHLTEKDKATIDRHKREWHERLWRASYEGTFLPEGGGLLRYVGRQSTGAPERGDPGKRYVSFFDPAPTRDFNAVATFLGGRQVYADRWQGTDWPVTLRRLERLREYPGDFWYDEGAGQSTGGYNRTSELSAMAGQALYVRSVRFNNKLKADMTDNMISMLEHGNVTLLDPDKCEGPMRDAVIAQAHELEEWRAHTLPSGTIRYAAPSGDNDDMAVAVMMAAMKGHEERGVRTEDEVMRMLGGGLNI